MMIMMNMPFAKFNSLILSDVLRRYQCDDLLVIKMTLSHYLLDFYFSFLIRS